MNAKHNLEDSVAFAVDAQTQAALASALRTSKLTGYATAPYVHFTSRYPHLLPTYAALIELGLPPELLTFDCVHSLAAHIAEPGGHLEVDYSDELEEVLRFLAMPFGVALGVGAFPSAIVMRGHGLGSAPGVWAQRPTDTVDNVHLALLSCADGYFDVMPTRCKTTDFIRRQLPALFSVSSVSDIPRDVLRFKALRALMVSH